MKKGWEYKKIGEVCKLKSGNSKANKSPVGDLPYVKVADMNIKGNDTFIKYSSTYVDRAYNSKDIIPCNSVIFPKRGGAILTNKKRITECEICCDLNIMAVIPNEQILPKYLYFYFVGLDFSKLFNGTTIPQINNCDIAPLQIPIPPLSEQKEIVEYLDSSFAKIDKLKENAAKNLEEAKALFQSALKDALEPKEGWEEKTLEQITEVKDGTHDSPKYVQNGIPFVTQKNITQNGFDILNTKKITIEDHNKYYKRSNVEYGDIIIAMIGANRGMSCIVDSKEIFSIKNVGLIKKSENINQKFLLFFLHSSSAQSYIQNKSNGGAQEFVGLKGLRNFPISFPSLSEQQSIVSYLDSLNEKVNTLQQNYSRICDECDALKQAILRQVFE